MSYAKLSPADTDPNPPTYLSPSDQFNPTTRSTSLKNLPPSHQSQTPRSYSPLNPGRPIETHLTMEDLDTTPTPTPEFGEVKLKEEETAEEGTEGRASFSPSATPSGGMIGEPFIKVEHSDVKNSSGMEYLGSRESYEREKEGGGRMSVGGGISHARFAGYGASGTSGMETRYRVGVWEGLWYGLWLVLMGVLVPLLIADALFRTTVLPPGAILAIATAPIVLKYIVSNIYSLIRYRRTTLMDPIGLLMLAFLTPQIILTLTFRLLPPLPFVLLFALLPPVFIALLLLTSLIPIFKWVSFPHHLARTFLTARNATVKRDWDEVVACDDGVRKAFRRCAWVAVGGCFVEGVGRTLLILFSPFYALGARALIIITWSTVLIYSIRHVKRAWGKAVDRISMGVTVTPIEK